jgi:uncharacterized protein YkwD
MPPILGAAPLPGKWRRAGRGTSQADAGNTVMGKAGILLAVSLFANGCIVAPIKPPVAPPPSTRDEINAFTQLVNAHRKKIGCKPLTWISPVAKVAQRHSEDMAFHRFFSHTNLQGESPFRRLERAGITYSLAAENIAAGQRTAEQVLQSWLTSKGHRRNIEDCKLLQHGVGLYQNHWTHVFVSMR